MIVVGVALLGVAAAVGWFARGRAAEVLARATWLLALAGAVVLVVAGGLALAGRPQTVTLTDAGFGELGLTADPISGLFLVVAFGVAVPVLVAGATTAASRPRLGAAAALVLGCTALVLCARDLVVLVAGWEGLGFAFYLAIGYDRGPRSTSRAALLALAFSKASGAALLLGGLSLAAVSHTFVLADLAHGVGPVRSGLAFALLVAAFCTKVGLVPLHVWLPPGYATAPGPVRAVLAGVAVNVGFYGLWRTLTVLGHAPVWLTCGVLVVGGASAALGIAQAAVHADVVRLVAWSSVENAGLIVVGYGVALLGALTHSPLLTAAGLVAATAQVITHALGKSLLFVAVADGEDATGTTDLDRLRGLVRVRPAAGIGLLVGSITLAGLPLTVGFASEWLTLEALMQQFRLERLSLQLCNAAAAVLVALTIGVAGLTFVRVVALTVFGTPPVRERPAASAGRTTGRWARGATAVAVALLSLGCLAGAAFAPLEIRLVAQGIAPVVGGAGFDALTPTWILRPVFAEFSALSPSWLWIVLPAYVVLIVLFTWAVAGRRSARVRRVPAWRSASQGVAGVPGYTSFAFANPIRKVLAGLLMTRHELREVAAPTGHEPEPGPEPRPEPPHEPTARRAALGYSVDVDDVVERYLYRPVGPVFRALVRGAKRLQSGRLDAYMAYMLVALVAIIALVTARAAG